MVRVSAQKQIGLALLAATLGLGCSCEPFPDLISGHGIDAGVDAGAPLVCGAGFGDCDGDGLSCETTLNGNDAHCGRCGRDCLAGGCINNVCGTVLLAFDDAGAGGIGIADGVPVWTTPRGDVRRPGTPEGTVVVTTSPRPLSLATHGGAVAWSTQSGAVEYLPALTGTVQQLAAGRDITWGTVAIDDDFIYWPVVDAGLIERAPRDGGAVSIYARLPGAHSVTSGPPVLFDGPEGVFTLRGDGGLNPVSTDVVEPTHLAVAGGFVFVCETRSNRVSRIELATGSRVTSEAQPGAHGIVADQDGAFWATDFDLMHWPLDGGAPRRFRAQPSVHRITLTPQALYWTEFQGPVRMQTR
jgi:hypothetical protein